MTFIYRFEYNANTNMLHIVTSPSETHENPSKWMNSIFTIALGQQRVTNKVTKGWSYGTNSSFCITGPELSQPRILIPDGCLVDEMHDLLVVVEVAYHQSAKQILRKVEENWVKVPTVVAVIVIKMEESPGYRGPAADKALTESVISRSDWFRREWPLDDITHDGHTWYGRSFARFIIFIKRANGPQDETTGVCFHFSLILRRYPNGRCTDCDPTSFSASA
jgi:hypothetical protein